MIVGWFDPDAPYPIPRVNVALSLPRISKDWAVIPFIVDTGAGVTCLHLHDAMRRARIDPVVLGDPLRWQSVELHLLSSSPDRATPTIP